MGETYDDLHRVREAVAGRLDPGTLTAHERPYYYDLLAEAMAKSSPAAIEVMADIGRQPGAVGDDAAGRLVRRLPGGGVEVIEE